MSSWTQFIIRRFWSLFLDLLSPHGGDPRVLLAVQQTHRRLNTSKVLFKGVLGLGSKENGSKDSMTQPMIRRLEDVLN